MVFQSKRKQELQAALEKLETAENRVAELEADWQAIQRSVALAVMSGDGLFESVSDVFLDMLGYQEQHLIGKHHRVLCKPEDARGEEYIRFWRELVTGHVQQGRFLNLGADGQPVWLEARYLPVLSDKGIVKRIIMMASGPTEALPA
ncbi:PAS domain-containing protein [Marinobacter adhaerens]|uniref:PAS domain-containing protein n=1 Tax=Marinobacter adhaerens TaxID=1033846 RepID=UPI001E5C4178|nr:PAS domain-containing protein [Marinobacter adhaerens]MCD1647392.1 PAS domain-containing protein [Marinobacter adhaerens]